MNLFRFFLGLAFVILALCVSRVFLRIAENDDPLLAGGLLVLLIYILGSLLAVAFGI